MSAGHLLFAAMTTAYIIVAVRYLEDRDLLAQFGDTYREYQRRVPALLPIGGLGGTAPNEADPRDGVAGNLP